MKLGISIVVPCYNNAKYLKELVNSVLCHKINFPYEIIIIDDNSEKKQEYSGLDISCVKILYNKRNEGVQSCRTKGLYLASYKYIMMLDADDKLAMNQEEGYINSAIELLENNSDIAFVHGLVKMFGQFSDYTISAYPLTAKLVAHKHHVQTSIIYRKEDGIYAGGYSNSIKKWQDWTFGVALLDGRLRQNKKIEIGFLDMESYMYRIHSAERISQSSVSEYEMILKTIDLYPTFFSHFYGGIDNMSLAKQLLVSKPTRLLDLLYVAKYNLDIAKSIVATRKYDVNNGRIGDYIP